jgi:hypothetical protein
MCKLSSSKYLPNFDLMTSKNVLCAYLRKLIIIIRERERERERESWKAGQLPAGSMQVIRCRPGPLVLCSVLGARALSWNG